MSAIVPWSAFYDLTRADLPGASDAITNQALRNAAIDFCNATESWLVDSDPMDVVANQDTYDLVPPGGVEQAEVILVKRAWINGWRMAPIAEDVLGQSYIDWAVVKWDIPLHYTQYAPTKFTLIPKPALDWPGILKLRLVLRPSQDASGAPDFLANRYRQEIAWGARAELLEMVGKPWSSPAAAGQARLRYEAAKRAAAVSVQRSFGRARTYVRIPRGGR